MRIAASSLDELAKRSGPQTDTSTLIQGIDHEQSSLRLTTTEPFQCRQRASSPESGDPELARNLSPHVFFGTESVKNCVARDIHDSVREILESGILAHCFVA